MLNRSKLRRQLMTTLLALGSLGVVAGATPAAADKLIPADTGSSCWETCTAHERVPINSGRTGFSCVAKVEGTLTRTGYNSGDYADRPTCRAYFGGQVRPYANYSCWCSDLGVRFRRRRR